MTDEATIRGFFDPFMDLDPTKYDDVLRDLAGAHDDLSSPKMGTINDVANDVSDWQGTAADSFNENVLGEFPGRVSLQLQLIAEMILATNASREIALKTQQDIITVAVGLEAGLEALNKSCTGCSKDELLKVFLIIGAIGAAIAGVGAVLGVIGAGATAAGVTASAAATTSAAAAPGVSAAAAGFGLLSGTGIAGNAFNSGPEQLSLKGDTVDELLESAKKSITALNKAIDDQEKKVKTTLTEDTAKMAKFQMEVADAKLPMDDFRPTI